MTGPLFYVRTRIQLRQQMAARGLKRDHINILMDGLQDEDIDSTAKASGIPLEAPVMAAGAVAALGDGTILNAIIDFLKSDAGQALIKALLTLLLGAL